MRRKLTPAFVKTAAAEVDAERTVYWDTASVGFGLMVTAAGHRSFVVQYRAGRRSRRITLKDGLTLDQAKKEARKIVGEVAKGGDPLAERRRVETSAQTRLKALPKNTSSARAPACAQSASAAGRSRS